MIWFPCTYHILIVFHCLFLPLACKYSLNDRGQWKVVIESLSIRVEAIGLLGWNHLESEPSLRREADLLTKKFMSMAVQMRKDLQMDSWLHEPKSSWKFSMYKEVRSVEAFGYYQLAQLRGDDPKKADEVSIGYYEKAKVLRNLIGDTALAKSIESTIAAVKTGFGGEGKAVTRTKDGVSVIAEGGENKASYLERSREIYQLSIQNDGEGSEITIKKGAVLAKVLSLSNRRIEGERLAAKLVKTGRLVHGIDHECTEFAQDILEECKQRFVAVNSPGLMGKNFLFLRYEDNGEKCVVQGPMAGTKAESPDEEMTYTYPSFVVIPKMSCPVFCRGLQKASHLNGMLGEVRGIGKDKVGAIRYEVHFDQSIKPVLIKPANLRICLELPNEE